MCNEDKPPGLEASSLDLYSVTHPCAHLDVVGRHGPTIELHAGSFREALEMERHAPFFCGVRDLWRGGGAPAARQGPRPDDHGQEDGGA
jgi:hypothetical protein